MPHFRRARPEYIPERVYSAHRRVKEVAALLGLWFLYEARGGFGQDCFRGHLVLSRLQLAFISGQIMPIWKWLIVDICG
jgi:hypothetical protein